MHRTRPPRGRDDENGDANVAEPSWFKYYAKLPVWMQNVCCSLAGIRMRRERFNKCFRRALELMEESQWWPLDRQKAYQDEQLAKMIRHAYDSVPYYRQVMEERKLTPDDIRTAEDLPKLPILTKDTVRYRFRDMISRTWPKKRMIYLHSGGTTGTGLELVEDRDTPPWLWASCWRHRARFGLKHTDPFIVFAGRSVVPMSSMDPPIWRRNIFMHQTYVSAHHMSKQNIGPLVEYLQKRRVKYYGGYPSVLYLVADYLLDKGIHLNHPPRAVCTASETVLPYQRQVIEDALNTEVVDHYGATEHFGSISECERHTYHVDMEVGVVEFLPTDYDSGGMRNVIVTGLRNPVMPLIRYEINDLATLSEKPCPCGREAPAVERIDGRIESYILTPDGRQLGRLGGFLFKNAFQVKEGQLIQHELDSVTVKVVPREGYSAEDEKHVLAELREYLGDSIEINIEPVAEIPREPNGKFRHIISTVWRDRHKPSPADK